MIPLKTVMQELSPQRRRKIKKLADKMVDSMVTEAMSLTELRKDRQFTQAEIARILKITQENVSRMEKRKDPHVSTLSKAVEAMGGRLSLIAEFPDRGPVILNAVASQRKSRR